MNVVPAWNDGDIVANNHNFDMTQLKNVVIMNRFKKQSIQAGGIRVFRFRLLRKCIILCRFLSIEMI